MINRLFPIEFLLDTGASDVALPADVVLTLVTTGTLQSNDFIGYTTYVLADGQSVPSATFKIRELQVGKHVARNVTASVGNIGTEPLLGGSFLSTLGSWTIDNQRNALVLSR
jgi:clan AA aspartic protease (TIGR02281 family)